MSFLWALSAGSRIKSPEADIRLEATFLPGEPVTPLQALLLTNLSAEQLIGLNETAYGYNMSSMAWEVTARCDGPWLFSTTLPTRRLQRCLSS